MTKPVLNLATRTLLLGIEATDIPTNPSSAESSDVANRVQARVSQGVETRMRRLIEDGLEAGELLPGDTLPPERELAEHLSVSRGSVRRALSLLEERGLVQRRQGRGTFISPVDRSNRSSAAEASQAREPEIVQTGPVGFLIPAPQSSFYIDMRCAFEQHINESLGRQMMSGRTNAQADIIEREVLRLLGEGVSAMFVIPTGRPDESPAVYRTLRRFRIPFVTALRGAPGVPSPVVKVRGEQIGRCAGRAIAQAGHKRVGFFSMHVNENVESLIRGLNEELRRIGGACPDELQRFGRIPEVNQARWVYGVGEKVPIEGARNTDELHRDLDSLLSLDDPPTALMTSSDHLAEEIYLLLLDLGLRVPDDISVISYGTAGAGIGLRGRLAGVSVDTGAMGRAAAVALEQIIRGERSLDNDEHIEIGCRFVDSATLGRGPAQPSERDHDGEERTA